ncbi:MAG: putative glycosyl transferase/polysaccharide deacetylase [Gemmatimonadetes bacterium]|nr:putative glycosyl transferase/polysaccharide deacetylase [Gemmatimonadota bacterium]
MTSPHSRRVFADPAGRRWKRVRGAALLMGVVTTALMLLGIASTLFAPDLPDLVPGVAAAVRHGPVLALTRQARRRIAARRALFASLQRHRPPPSLRPSRLPLRRALPSRPVKPHRPIVAGFYVNWDDNSLSAFRQHARDLDWVVCEWGFLAPGTDTVQFAIDAKLLYVAGQMQPAERPRIMLMASNFSRTTQRFDVDAVRRLLATPESRARAVAQLAAAAARYGLGGVTVDFEDLPPEMVAPVADFTARLHAALAPAGRVVSQAVPAEAEPAALKAYAAAADYLFVMLYDEHYGSGDPGAVASQDWYAARARRALASIPAEKAILAIGAYGYEWNDAEPDAQGVEMTFQDIVQAARDAGVQPRVDPRTLNPFLAWSDPDSTDHVLWYLDGTTALNQARVGVALGAAGRAVWRLGSEDPSLWAAVGRTGSFGAGALRSIPPGYDVEFRGTGEMLEVRARPTAGVRSLRVDARTGMVVDQRLERFPSPWLVRRFGASAHRVALTFDDGPDGTWTPQILDTLKAYGAPATFFVIGRNVETQLALTRRMVREGHELGNHTFTHPNLALTSDYVTRLELNATQRLLEAVVNRRIVFFRPPYFGDAEPTQEDELDPVGIASDMGYVTAGLHIDSEDWQQPGAGRIVRAVMDARAAGNVVLLHDGGGPRAQTVAALGPIIRALRARGDTLVLLSELAGIPRDRAMPPLPAGDAAARLVGLASFGLLGLLEWTLYWTFLAAVVLGIGRLALILALAAVQRFLRRPPAPDRAFAPFVSVIVPAYNEARVIRRTVESLLDQTYTGPLEIVVVDDGSPDGTYEVAMEAFAGDPRVAVHRKPNGGKASALNYGIERARGEIVVGLDADTLFVPDTLAELVAPLRDPAVGAVAGNAKVGNRINLVTRWQALEYVTSQNLDRRAFSLLDCITVVPGAVGAWRRELVLAVGGFSADTLAEDQDLTLAIRRRGFRIAYADGAVAYTEAPDTLRTLAKQRFRWAFGTLQCAWKHRAVFLRPRYGSLGLVALPNVWIFQLLFAALSPLADLMFLWSLVSVWMVREQHGDTYALTSLEQVLGFYAVFLLVDWVAAVAAFLMEPDEDRRLTWLIFIQRFAYRQVMYWVVVKSFAAALRGHLVGWGKLERKATVEVPA